MGEILGLAAWHLRINRKWAPEYEGYWLTACFSGKSSGDKFGADNRFVRSTNSPCSIMVFTIELLHSVDRLRACRERSRRVDCLTVDSDIYLEGRGLE